MLGFVNQRDEVDILYFVIDYLNVLELSSQSLWLAPYQPSGGWNSGVISLSVCWCSLVQVTKPTYSRSSMLELVITLGGPRGRSAAKRKSVM